MSYNIIQVLKFGNVVRDLHVYVFVGAEIIILSNGYCTICKSSTICIKQFH